MTTWSLYTRDPAGTIEAQIEDYQQLEVVERFLDVGTWILDLHHDSTALPWLLRHGSGIYLIRDDTEVVMSGWTTTLSRKRDATSNMVTLGGVDDNIWLAARRASPQPGAAAPPYSSSEYDVRTGTASTILRQYVDVNAGPSAVAARRVTWGGVGGLTVGADPVAGSTVTGRARWQPLLELLQELAQAGGVGFRTIHTGSALQFQTFALVDKSSTVQFSYELGNVLGHTYEGRTPEVSHVYVGGGGEGTARTIREIPNPAAIAAHGRHEDFVDRRDTTDAAELDQAGYEQLSERGETAAFSLTLAESTQVKYGDDWVLGDQVTAWLDDVPVVERIREIKHTLTPDESTITPVVATPGKHEATRLFGELERHSRRIRQLERR